MKLTKQLFGVALTAIAAGAFVSCTNELSDRMETSSDALKLLRAPEVYAWSGEQTLNATRSDVYAVPSVGSYSSTKSAISTRGQSSITIVDVRTQDIDKTHEEDIIEEYLPEKNSNLGEDIQENFLFKAEEDITFDIYPVVCNTWTPKTVGIFFYDNNGIYGEINNIFEGLTKNNNGRYEEGPWVWHPEIGENGETIQEPGTFLGKRISIPKGYVFGFFWNGNTNAGATTYYSIDKWNEECWATTGEGQKLEPETLSKLHGVTFELDGKTYLGLEDWTDFDYQDLVFTCPENLTEVPIEDIPEKGQPWPEETFPGGDGDVTEVPCHQCGHYHDGPSTDCEECHNGGPVDEDHQSCWEDPETSCPQCGHDHDGPSTDCEECHNGGPVDEDHQSCWEDKGTTTPPDKTAPDDIIHHKNEVEVNFELVDSHVDKNNNSIKDLASKLSIHVRHATDVEILIPVPTRYVIQSDDLYIFNEHYGKFEGDNKAGYHGVYGGTIEGAEQVLRYPINNTTVELHVQYVTANEAKDEPEPFNVGYIKVWTRGITQEVIDWCVEHNGDGINFEVWTYFGVSENETNNITRENLKFYLNQSTIEFKRNLTGQSDPDYYINAFGYDYVDGQWGQQHYDYINPDDCHVTPDDPDTTYLPRYNYKVREEMIENTVDEWSEHLNGTPYNYIWVKDGVTADEFHTAP
ncbi:MAG: hypothetical protein J1E16_02955 [Muribaculaceae bacterium]|nr:hypothetical protein [Muribaculaceae bacterium]